MKLFVDHCFFACGVELLQRCGYDIIKASDAGMEKASDEEIVSFCKKEGRIILTLDSDFNSLYRFPLGTHRGVVFFKINPFKPVTLLNILQILIKRKDSVFIENALVIVGRNKIRVVRGGRSTEIL